MNDKIKPLALDLCCGKGGWTNGLLSAGWDVIGIDIKDMGGYQGHLILADVVQVSKCVENFFPALKFQLVVASPPCQEYSKRGLPFKVFKNLPPPSNEIWEACEKIARDLKAPLILENVRNAQKYVRPAQWHLGSFYFWGELPALVPIIKPRKGFGGAKNWKDRIEFNDARRSNKRIMPDEFERLNPVSGSLRKIGGASLREQWSARIAMIPPEISEWIGRIYRPGPGPI